MATFETARHGQLAHQDLMVELNEQKADELAPFGSGEFLCECVDHDCLETVTLEYVDYLRTRSIVGSFVLSLGHRPTAGARLYVVAT
jgi:hypothetical protein